MRLVVFRNLNPPESDFKVLKHKKKIISIHRDQVCSKLVSRTNSPNSGLISIKKVKNRADFNFNQTIFQLTMNMVSWAMTTTPSGIQPLLMAILQAKI